MRWIVIKTTYHEVWTRFRCKMTGFPPVLLPPAEAAEALPSAAAQGVVRVVVADFMHLESEFSINNSPSSQFLFDAAPMDSSQLATPAVSPSPAVSLAPAVPGGWPSPRRAPGAAALRNQYSVNFCCGHRMPPLANRSRERGGIPVALPPPELHGSGCRRRRRSGSCRCLHQLVKFVIDKVITWTQVNPAGAR
jgi:hypothetical protein